MDRILYVVLFAVSLGALAGRGLEYPVGGLLFATPVILLACLALGFVFPQRNEKRRRVPLLAVPFVMFIFWLAFFLVFGEFDFAAILYHARHGFAAGTLEHRHVILLIGNAGLLFCLLYSWTKLVGWRVFDAIDRFAFLPLLLLNPLSFAVAEAAGVAMATPVPIAGEFRARPEVVASPARPPNLIHVYLESGEMTYEDEAAFGPTMKPLADFAGRGLKATGIEEISSTGWTIAGQVASKCGVPLITPWLRRSAKQNEASGFLPGAHCLGDFLSARGYHAEFAKGADLSFGGTDRFVFSHGYAAATDRSDFRARYPGHENSWGADDDVLFDWAEGRIRSLSRTDAPYALTLTTLGGHAPDGIVSPSCRSGSTRVSESPAILQGVECSNRLLARMLDRLDRDGLLENTVVVIQSDHLAKASTVSPQLWSRKRRDLFLAFGPGIPASIVHRPASMVDVYPTVLELMGFRLEGGRAGLGVSLIADRQTLLERLGRETLNLAVRADSELRHILWDAPATETAADNPGLPES